MTPPPDNKGRNKRREGDIDSFQQRPRTGLNDRASDHTVILALNARQRRLQSECTNPVHPRRNVHLVINEQEKTICIPHYEVAATIRRFSKEGYGFLPYLTEASVQGPADDTLPKRTA
jgi:hypothetical protein